MSQWAFAQWALNSNKGTAGHWKHWNHRHLSVKAWTLCLSVCLCVCVCVCICCPQISLWIRIRLTWVSTWLLLGLRMCDVGFVWTAMILLMNYFINALQILWALSTGATTVTWAPEPMTAHRSQNLWSKDRTDRHIQTRLRVNNVRHAFSRHVCFVSGAGGNGETGLLSRKCPSSMFGCWGTGSCGRDRGGWTTAAVTVGVDTAI